jgi:hypothetical protein
MQSAECAVPRHRQFRQCNTLPFLVPLNIAIDPLILHPFAPKIRCSFSAFAPEHLDFFLLANAMSGRKFRTFSYATPREVHAMLERNPERSDSFVTKLF